MGCGYSKSCREIFKELEILPVSKIQLLPPDTANNNNNIIISTITMGD